MNIDFKRLLPYVAMPVAFLLLVIMYFRPAFQGKVLQMGDIVQYQQMSRETREFREKTGEEALWNSTLFGGMPAYYTGTVYPNNIYRHIDRIFHFGLPRPADYVFLTFIGFYILLLTLRSGPWLGAAGAAAFALSSYFFIILEAGHTSKANAIAYMAPAAAGILLAYRGKLLPGAILTALFMGLELYANHYQITFYFVLMMVFVVLGLLADAIREKKTTQWLKATGILAIAAVIGVLPNLGTVWSISQYADYTMRGKAELKAVRGEAGEGKVKESGLEKEYALRWSYGVDETLTLLVPNFMGGASGSELTEESAFYEALLEVAKPDQARDYIRQAPTYRGTQPFTSGPVYAGAIVFFLFVLGLMTVKGGLKWGLLAATALAIMLSWGNNFLALTDIFFTYFPYYNKFRTPSMWLVVAEFTLPLLGLLALIQLFNAKEKTADMTRQILIAAGVSGGLALVIGLIGPAVIDFAAESDAAMFGKNSNSPQAQNVLSALADDRASMLRMDALRSALFILLSAGLLWAWSKNMVKSTLVVGLGLLALIVADMLPVNARYLNNENFVRKDDYEARFAPSKASKFIIETDKDPNYRVLNLSLNTFNDASTSYHHKSIGGYHPAKLRRYQDLIDYHIQPEIEAVRAALSQPGANDSTLRTALAGQRVLNMLNMRYLIYNPEAQPLRNRYAMGNAWFVAETKAAKDADEEIQAIGTIDPRRTAVVADAFKDALNGWQYTPDSTASIKLTAFAPNKVAYESQTASEQLAIFSEIYYADGWKAFIDGQPAAHFRANCVLRAMRIPAGKHTLEFRFEPETYATGERWSLIASVVLLLALLAGGFLLWRQTRRQEE